MIWKQIKHFQNLQNWKLCKYLHFYQNAIPTILPFSPILKLRKYITHVPKNIYIYIQNVFASVEYL